MKAIKWVADQIKGLSFSSIENASDFEKHIIEILSKQEKPLTITQISKICTMKPSCYRTKIMNMAEKNWIKRKHCKVVRSFVYFVN